MKKGTNMNKFFWGASTSGIQVEGGYNLGGKGLSTTDVRHVNEGIADTKVASDHYHHFKEDILLMKELGLKAYRFSFCWARIMPDGHHVNQEGLEFYDQIIQLCLENDIEPIPTLYHFEMPQALVDEFGGWKSRKCIDAFVEYAKICFQKWQGTIKHWVTINEQLIAMAASDLNGNHENDKVLQTKNMDRSRTRSPPNYKGREANKVLQQNSYQSRNNRTIQRICERGKILAINQKV